MLLPIIVFVTIKAVGNPSNPWTSKQEKAVYGTESWTLVNLKTLEILNVLDTNISDASVPQTSLLLLHPTVTRSE